MAGLRWRYLGAFTSAVVHALYVAAMSRLLTPTAFGLMAIATLTVSLGSFLSHMGVGQALVQRAEIDTDHVRASMTAGVVTGGGSALLLLLVASHISAVFDEPDAVPLLQAMSLSLLASGLTVTSYALLRRQLRFRELSMVQIIATVAAAAVGIGGAVAGMGVWSLVAAALSTSLVKLVLLYRATRHPLRPLWRIRELRELYAYGAVFSLARLGDFAAKNLDTFVVGATAATAALGTYNRAFHLVNLPLSAYLADSLTSVLFPALSRIHEDHDRLRSAFVSVLRLTAVVVVPLAAGLAIAAHEVVLTVLGDQWLAAIPLVGFFAVAAALNIVSKLMGLVCEARASLRPVLMIQTGHLIVLGGLLAVAATDGRLWTFAAALLAAELLRSLVYLPVLHRVVGLKPRTLVLALGPAVATAIPVAGAIAGVRAALPAGLPAPVVLLAEVIAGAVTLVIAIRALTGNVVRDDLRARLGTGDRLTRSRPVAALISAMLGPPAPQERP